MESKEFSFTLNSGKTISNSFKNDFSNDISFILQNYGIKKGDRIVIYMPTIPEAIMSMLACCRIGAIHSVVFGGFAYSELAERIKDCEPKMIITTSCGIEPKRKIEYYPIVRKALDLIYNDPSSDAIYVRDTASLLYEMIDSNTSKLFGGISISAGKVKSN